MHNEHRCALSGGSALERYSSRSEFGEFENSSTGDPKIKRQHAPSTRPSATRRRKLKQLFERPAGAQSACFETEWQFCEVLMKIISCLNVCQIDKWVSLFSAVACNSRTGPADRPIGRRSPATRQLLLKFGRSAERPIGRPIGLQRYLNTSWLPNGTKGLSGVTDCLFPRFGR